MPRWARSCRPGCRQDHKHEGDHENQAWRAERWLTSTIKTRPGPLSVARGLDIAPCIRATALDSASPVPALLRLPGCAEASSCRGWYAKHQADHQSDGPCAPVAFPPCPAHAAHVPAGHFFCPFVGRKKPVTIRLSTPRMRQHHLAFSRSTRILSQPFSAGR